MIPLDPAGLEAAARQLAETAEVVRAYLAAAGRAAATPDPPTDERRPWPIAPDTVMPPRRQPVRWGSRADDPPTEIHDDPGKTKAYLAGLAAGRTEAAAASPDERLREALRDANEYLAQIADVSPSEVADAIDSVRAQIKDALAATDSRGKPDGASVPDQSCATCGGSGDRNGNRRAADPFGTCPGCGGTGNVAAADREAPDEGQTFTASVTMGQHREGCDPTKRDRYGLVCWGCADALPVSDEPKETTT